MDTYDAGLLNDYGGGDVGWWQDYLRAELGRAEEFYRDQHDRLMAEKDAEIERLREALGAELAATRDKALEDAATLANNRIRRWLEIEPPYNGDLDEAIALIEELPAAIRAMIAAREKK